MDDDNDAREFFDAADSDVNDDNDTDEDDLYFMDSSDEESDEGSESDDGSSTGEPLSKKQKKNQSNKLRKRASTTRAAEAEAAAAEAYDFGVNHRWPTPEHFTDKNMIDFCGKLATLLDEFYANEELTEDEFLSALRSLPLVKEKRDGIPDFIKAILDDKVPRGSDSIKLLIGYCSKILDDGRQADLSTTDAFSGHVMQTLLGELGATDVIFANGRGKCVQTDPLTTATGFAGCESHTSAEKKLFIASFKVLVFFVSRYAKSKITNIHCMSAAIAQLVTGDDNLDLATNYLNLTLSHDLANWCSSFGFNNIDLNGSYHTKYLCPVSKGMTSRKVAKGMVSSMTGLQLVDSVISWGSEQFRTGRGSEDEQKLGLFSAIAGVQGVYLPPYRDAREKVGDEDFGAQFFSDSMSAYGRELGLKFGAMTDFEMQQYQLAKLMGAGRKSYDEAAAIVKKRAEKRRKGQIARGKALGDEWGEVNGKETEEELKQRQLGGLIDDGWSSDEAAAEVEKRAKKRFEARSAVGKKRAFRVFKKEHFDEDDRGKARRRATNKKYRENEENRSEIKAKQADSLKKKWKCKSCDWSCSNHHRMRDMKSHLER